MKNVKAKIIVNLVTIVRVIGTFLIPFISNTIKPEEFIIYIALIFITDSIDGILARRFKVCTLFGALLDTVADKLFGIATLLVLAKIYPIMFLPVLAEILIMFINTTSGSKGANVESSKIGKYKTWVLGICTVGGFFVVYSKSFIKLIKEETLIGKSIINFLRFLDSNQKIIIIIIALISFITCFVVATDYYIRTKKDIDRNKINTKKIKLKKGKDLLIALFDEDFYEKTKKEPLIYRLGREEN